MQIKLLLLIPIILLVFWGCAKHTKTEIKMLDDNEVELQADVLKHDTKENGWNYKEVDRDYIDTLLLDVCSTTDLEFMDLYPIIDSIESDKYENSILVDLLRTKDFEITNWGRGNWMEGPRIVSFTMSNQQCDCLVDKLYYSTEQEGNYKVTERIKCEKDYK